MELQQQYGANVQFFGVPDPTTAVDSQANFIETTGSQAITHLIDTERSVWTGFEVVSRMTYIVVTADGTQRRVDLDDLGDTLAALAST